MHCVSVPPLVVSHLEDGDLDGDDHAGLVRGPGVVLLAEHHDVHTLSSGGTGQGEKKDSGEAKGFRSPSRRSEGWFLRVRVQVGH